MQPCYFTKPLLKRKEKDNFNLAQNSTVETEIKILIENII